MVNLVSLVELIAITLLFLFIGLTMGFASSRMNKLGFLGLGFFIGSLVWLGALLFSGSLSSITIFVDYVLTLNSLVKSPFILNNPILTAVFALIVFLEIGYFTGYASARSTIVPELSVPRNGQTLTQRPKMVGTNAVSDNISQQIATERQAMVGATEARTLTPAISPYIVRSVNQRSLGQNLSEDEKTLASLFVVGRVGEIVPRLDDSVPEGYTYEQLRYLDWDMPRKTTALNSLVVRGYLNATPKEKVMKCKQCGSMRLQIRSECPDCGSLRTQRYKVLEHFPCGMIDKEENFRRENDELVCPKCNKKMNLIGMDYRSLGSMFACADCGALNKELSTAIKCTKCSHVAKPDEETEDHLFSYTLNPSMLPRLRQIVKPVQTIANYFEGIGYTVYTPAKVKGKSGIEHTVDILAQERVKKTVAPPIISGSAKPPESISSRSIAIEILVSESEVKLDDITRVFGKMNDLQNESVVIAIPSISENAKNYAATYRINVVEAETAAVAITRLEKILKLESSTNRAVRSF